jgi:hypothetical protein
VGTINRVDPKGLESGEFGGFGGSGGIGSPGGEQRKTYYGYCAEWMCFSRTWYTFIGTPMICTRLCMCYELDCKGEKGNVRLCKQRTIVFPPGMNGPTLLPGA